jgi:hypothetical protein
VLVLLNLYNVSMRVYWRFWSKHTMKIRFSISSAVRVVFKNRFEKLITVCEKSEYSASLECVSRLDLRARIASQSSTEKTLLCCSNKSRRMKRNLAEDSMPSTPSSFIARMSLNTSHSYLWWCLHASD